MRNIKITYEYDGTNFFGMQRQKNDRTVAGEMERVIKTLLKEEVELINSGRTDRGVHALCQVSNFFTNSKIPLSNFKHALSNILPEDINLKNVEEVPEDFNSRFSAKWRSYIYKLSHNKNIFDRNKVMFTKDEIDCEKLNEILKQLKGKHDFGSFRKADCTAVNGEREIYEIYSYKEKDEVHIYIKANSFLKSMVRIIVASSLAVYFNEKPKDYLKQKLNNPNIKENGKLIAPPQGLYLYEVNYGD